MSYHIARPNCPSCGRLCICLIRIPWAFTVERDPANFQGPVPAPLCLRALSETREGCSTRKRQVEVRRAAINDEQKWKHKYSVRWALSGGNFKVWFCTVLLGAPVTPSRSWLDHTRFVGHFVIPRNSLCTSWSLSHGQLLVDDPDEDTSLRPSAPSWTAKSLSTTRAFPWATNSAYSVWLPSPIPPTLAPSLMSS